MAVIQDLVLTFCPTMYSVHQKKLKLLMPVLDMFQRGLNDFSIPASQNRTNVKANIETLCSGLCNRNTFHHIHSSLKFAQGQ